MASAFGTLLATLPFNWIYTKFGGRIVFFCAGLLSIVSSALIPVCAKISFFYLYIARFVQGIAFASDFACMGIICVRWSPLKESGFYISVLTCYTPLSNLISSPISGLV
jgi:MFS family permease